MYRIERSKAVDPKGSARKVRRSMTTGGEWRTTVELFRLDSSSINRICMAVKYDADLSVFLLGERSLSTGEASTSVPDAEGLRCNVSGIKKIMEQPKARMT
jgi:hypothetical protein